MKSAVGISLLGGVVLASSSSNIKFVAQQPLLQNACPSNSLIHDTNCQPSTQDAWNIPLPNLAPNSTHISPLIHSLQESRKRAQQTKNFPWTYWPECFSLDDENEPFCVFTDTAFAYGRGISIITTQSLAYGMRDKIAFTQPHLFTHLNNYNSPPYYQHEFPNKGRGLIANTTLQRGDLIFSSTPILVTDPDMDDLPEPERLALLYRSIATLPPATQSLFWGLQSDTPTTEPGSDALDTRVTTNNFAVEIDDVAQSIVMPEIAMMNHDCRPNAAYFFDQNTMAQYVHAIRPINPGEEITITYIDNEKPRARRMAKLHLNWGFTCSCSACSVNIAQAADSDARIAQIGQLEKVLDDWTDASGASVSMAELLVSLYQQERLWAGLATAYQYAAETHASFGRKWDAVKYARLSLEYSLLDKGWADPDVAAMKKMAEEPEQTWAWKKRMGLGHAHHHHGHGHE
ncbi:hypothetical protein ACJQWK_01835 [Exserohilum turcicum]